MRSLARFKIFFSVFFLTVFFVYPCFPAETRAEKDFYSKMRYAMHLRSDAEKRSFILAFFGQPDRVFIEKGKYVWFYDEVKNSLTENSTLQNVYFYFDDESFIGVEVKGPSGDDVYLEWDPKRAL